MARNFSLIACANFDREILALQSSPDFQDVRFKTLPVNCDQVEAEWHGLDEAVGVLPQRRVFRLRLRQLLSDPGREGL